VSGLDNTKLRRAFGSFMTGVTVVTTATPAGVPIGFTANSFTSVSMNPPLLLVCPGKKLNCFEIFEQCDYFAVNILAENQQDVSNTFARVSDDRFAQIKWREDAHGCPIFSDVAASFSCSVHARHDAGDHMVLMGEIQSLTHSERAGLGYSNGSYFSLGLERRANELISPSQPVSVGAILEQDGKLLLLKSAEGLQPPTVNATHRTGALNALRDHLGNAGFEVEFGPVYSIFQNHASNDHTIIYRGKVHQTGRLTDCAYYSIETLESATYANQAITTMINRYLFERVHGAYGLYVGDELSGDIHHFDEVAR